MNFCNSGGYLAGSDAWLPTDPHDYFRAAYGFGCVGCNHLVCPRCQQTVRHALGYSDVPRVDAATLFAAPRWSELEGAKPTDGQGRLYVCACELYLALGYKHLDTSGESDPDSLPPWRCAGHPTLEPPERIADIEVTGDWSRLVTEHLEAKSRLHPSIDRIPGFTLTRIFQALAKREDQRDLGVEVGHRGDAASITTREAVVLFFVLNSDAAGFDLVIAAWRDDPSRFDDVPATFGLDRRLKSTLLDAISDRIVRRRSAGQVSAADELLDTWRWAALRGEGLGVKLHTAALMDPAWTKDHVEQLLVLSPADWYRVILSIHVEFPMRLVPGCRRAITEGHATRERVAAALTEQYGDKAGPAIAAL